jgi:peptidoglycan/LPS O-acetylase OafA/YrhL
VTEVQGLRARPRLHELDLLRLIAASLVVAYHFTFFGPATGMSPLSYHQIDPYARYGFLGVNLFFLISGFVILMTAERSTAWQFAVSRAVRLYPAYWVCCTATFLGLLALPHPGFHVSAGQYLANLTMVGPLAGAEYVDGVYWSLLVELRFYFLMFGLLASGLLRHVRVVLGVWLALSLLAHYHLAETRVTNLLLVTDWSSYFIAGAMCYHARSRARWDWYATAVVTACGVIAVQRAVAASADEALGLGTWADPRVVTGLVAAFFLIFILIARDWTARLRSPRFIALGGLTYPLYLLHQRLGYTIFQHTSRAWHPQILLWAVTATIVGAAYVVYRFVEPPLAARLHRLLTVTPSR